MLAHRTPPVHGTAIIGDLVYDTLKSKNIELIYIGLSTSLDISDSGKLNFRKLFLLFRIFKELSISLIKLKPSIIYVTPSMAGIAFYRDFLYILMIKLYKYVFKNCRIILHLHMRPVNANWLQKNYLFKILFRRVEIIFLSKLLIRDYSIFKLNDCVVHILPNAIKPLLNKELTINKVSDNYSKVRTKNNTINVLYLGHMIKSKGYRRALDVAKYILNQNKKYKFLFVGEYGSVYDKEYFDHYISSNYLVSDITYLGPCTNDIDKMNLFLNNDILIFPSYSEAYPLTILEAFSFGLPVVATDTGAVEEIVSGEFGQIVSDICSYDNYIKKFSQSVLNQEKKWNKKLAIKCIEDFHSRWTEKKFSSTLSKIINN